MDKTGGSGRFRTFLIKEVEVVYAIISSFVSSLDLEVNTEHSV